ncbi:hypothetical protein BJ912DRAFT_1139347 [Pholiota molesta]|nr:hypothetical protein BJ912DRAFT_1139347 [Pholiota molesta]
MDDISELPRTQRHHTLRALSTSLRRNSNAIGESQSIATVAALAPLYTPVPAYQQHLQSGAHTSPRQTELGGPASPRPTSARRWRPTFSPRIIVLGHHGAPNPQGAGPSSMDSAQVPGHAATTRRQSNGMGDAHYVH